MSDRRFLSDDLDLDELKSLCGDIPEEAGSFSLEDILAEYKYDDTVNVKLLSREKTPKNPAHPAEPDKRRGEQGGPPEKVVRPPAEAGTDEKAGTIRARETGADAAKPSVRVPKTDGKAGTELPGGPVPKDAASEIRVFEKRFNMDDGLEPEPEPEPEAIPARDFVPEPAPPEREPLWAEGLSEDDPAPDAAQAMKDRLGGLGFRTAAVFILWLLLSYVSLAHRFLWPLPSFAEYVKAPFIHLFIESFLLLAAMLFGADVLAKGLRDLARLKPGMETLCAAGCLSSLLHALSVMARPEWGGYLPYCAVSAGALFFAAWGRYLSVSAMYTGFRTAAVTAAPYLVQGGKTVCGDTPGCVKYASGNTDGFVGRCMQEDVMERVSRYLAPMLLVACLVFAGLCSFGRHEPARFFWAWAAVSAPAAAFPAYISFSLPFYFVARRLFMSGVSIAGWPGARAMKKSRAVVLTDCDLFPPGTVSLNGLKVLGGYPVDRVIAYTASVVSASGSGLARVFAELLQGQSASILKVENFLHYEGGGMGADIGGNRVLVGSPNFLLRMGIKAPKGISSGSVVLTAVNQEPVAVFVLNYAVTKAARRALNSLIHHRLVPVLATRDFNITPAFFSRKFKISSDVPEFPPTDEKLRLSDAGNSPEGGPDAVLCREGLPVYSECVQLGRRLCSVSRLNAVFSVLVAAVGVMIMFYLAFTGSFAAAAPGNVLAYMLLWTVSSLIVSCGVSRY